MTANGVPKLTLQDLDERHPNKFEWKYEMRREAQETLSGLYVGGFQPSWNFQTLQALGITHILCIAEEREAHLFRARFPDSFTYRIEAIRDADDQNLIRIFPESHAFIDSVLQNNGRVLVHCGDGISRSPAIVVSYIMCKTGLSLDEAFQFVQSRRFCIAPRVEFQHQIEAYYPIFQARQAVSANLAVQTASASRRRGRDEHEDQDAAINNDRPVLIGLTDADMVQRRPLPAWSQQGAFA
ncbi:hypothetical protein OIV83_002483 [Microbotryomycetes sp. JL201]|nr:hypothetical protein OIV83_002483 [Microbotryomycetes sp. JL201]